MEWGTVAAVAGLLALQSAAFGYMLTWLREDMRELRKDLNDLRKEFSDFREEMRSELRDLRGEIGGPPSASPASPHRA